MSAHDPDALLRNAGALGHIVSIETRRVGKLNGKVPVCLCGWRGNFSPPNAPRAMDTVVRGHLHDVLDRGRRCA